RILAIVAQRQGWTVPLVFLMINSGLLKGVCNMASRFSLLIAVTFGLLLTISCAKKQVAPEGPAVGGAEGGKLDTAINSQEIGLDTGGSDSGKIAGLSSIHFDYDSSTLTSDARRQLSENAEWMKKNGKVTLQVEGHCDKRGSVEYNLAL